MGDAGGTSGVELTPELVRLIRRKAYLRQPSVERRRAEKGRYRKGWEVRLVLRDEAELGEAQRVVEEAGLRTGRPFTKHSRWVLPLYGRKTAELVKAHVRRKRGEGRA